MLAAEEGEMRRSADEWRKAGTPGKQKGKKGEKQRKKKSAEWLLMSSPSSSRTAMQFEGAKAGE
jgi:hypothetical protein